MVDRAVVAKLKAEPKHKEVPKHKEDQDLKPKEAQEHNPK